MIASRELDAQVAEKVFGLTVVWEAGVPFLLHEVSPCPHYSSEIGAMGELVNQMNDRGWYFECSQMDHHTAIGATATFTRTPLIRIEDGITEVAATIPLAASLAALHAVNAEVPV